MKVNYPINYSGYIPILRGILLLLKSNTLALTQLGPYIYFVMQADYDPKHNHYTVILRDDRQIAKEIGVSSTTIYRYRKDLINAGLLYEENNLTYISNFHMFELGWVKKIAKQKLPAMQNLFAQKQLNESDFELLIANVKSAKPENIPQSFNASSKDNLLSEEDMKWISENVKEGNEVKS